MSQNPVASGRGEASGESRGETYQSPPGPDGWPVVGSAVSFARDPFTFYENLAEYGDIAQFSVFGLEFTPLLHPDHIEQVLLDDHDKFDKWLADDLVDLHFAPEGLVFTEGETWRRQRTIIQDAFTIDRIQSYGDTMAEYAAEHVADWDDGEEIALNEAFSDLTLRILAHTLLDVDVSSDDRYGTLLREAMSAINDRSEPKLSNFLPGWVPTPTNRRYQRYVAELRDGVDELIADRRGDTDDHEDLLSLFLGAEDEQGRSLSETEVRDQLITFLGAGTETTALALTYACLEIANHDDVRRKLNAEHERVLDGEPPGLSDLGDLTYTEQVIDETLRLYPPAYAMFRQTTEDVTIGDYHLPEGTTVTLPQFHLHTDDRWYENPDQFCPGRWTEDFEAEIPDYAYFPFGGGPRHCIGMRFAMMELKTVLPTVCQQVDLELLSDPDPDFEPGVTLQPAEDVRVRVHERA